MKGPLISLDIMIEAQELSESGHKLPIRLSKTVCESLADRLSLDALNSLDADCLVRPIPGQRYSLEGTVAADIVQSCVVSGDPVATSLQFNIRREYAEDIDPLAGLSEEEEAEYTDEDSDIDPLTDGQIDVGNAIYEELALQIPPYPRAAGANFDGYATEIADSDTSENPFAVLESLKTKLKSDS